MEETSSIESVAISIAIDLYHGDNSNLTRVIQECPEAIERKGAVARAAEGNNVAALKTLIAHGFSVHPVRCKCTSADSFHYLWYSPITEAAENLAFEALETLVEAGADVNQIIDGGPWPPLAATIRHAKPSNLVQACKMINRLIELGADVNVVFYSIPEKKHYTPLSYVLEVTPQKKVREALTSILTAHGARRYERPIKPKFRDKIPREDWVRGKLTFNRRKAGALGTLEIFGREYRFRWIPAGEFMMGSPNDEQEREKNERLHSVSIEKGFWITETHITQAAYREVMDENPSMCQNRDLDGDDSSKYDYPVESVSWFDAKAFCAELNALTKGSPIFFRLPTEAEWEYACRAGTTTPFFFGTEHNGTLDNIDGTAPYGTTVEGPCVGAPTPVRSYPPNSWGLYDLHGNVAEWCEDVFRKSAPKYFNPPQIDVDYRETDEDPDPDVERSVRGGSFQSDGRGARSALRNSMAAIDAIDDVGFRVVAVKMEK